MVAVAVDKVEKGPRIPQAAEKAEYHRKSCAARRQHTVIGSSHVGTVAIS